jgi:ornithine cyclodeaminase/alanine dehydrogenase-like protein (mu-crystallin family)
MRDAIHAMWMAFADFAQGKAVNQPRRRMFLPGGAVLHAMAGAYRNYFGTKVYATHPKHGAHFTFLLYDAETGRPLAQFEANHLGQIRTGAVSGLAAGLLAREDKPLVVAMIGSGFQARTQLEAVAAVRSVSKVQVWSRDAAKRQAFATRMSGELNLDVTSAASLRNATKDADIVITATSAKDPVITAEDVAPAALILAVGSNNPQRRELSSDLVQRARIVVDDLDACRIEAGDLLLGLTDAAWQQIEQLKDLVAEKTKAGQSGRLTVFKSVGLGLEDVAAAAVIYEQAIPERKPVDRNPATR